VRRARSLAVLCAGLFAGLGGAAITVGSVGNFGSNITAGKGFVAISLVALARQRIGWALVAAFLFGTLEAAEARLQDVDGVPVELLPALPWVAVVIALVVLAVSRTHRVRRAA
jgi:simple sugar transport system permease protein